MFKIYDIDIKDIHEYMLIKIPQHNISKNNISKDNISKDNISKDNISKDKDNISKDKKFTDCYCKFNKKYNNSKNTNITDTLFWCFYTLYTNYEYVSNEKLFNTEKTFKLNFISEIRNSKDILKKNKLSINSIENEFVNEKKISLDGLKALCLIFKKNIIIVRENKTYYKYFYDKEDNLENYDFINIINCNKYNNYTLSESENNIEKIKEILDNYYYLDNHNKILKSISYYKLQDIYDIANKLSINLYKEVNKKKTKIDLYKEIYNLLLN